MLSTGTIVGIAMSVFVVVVLLIVLLMVRLYFSFMISPYASYALHSSPYPHHLLIFLAFPII
jgi:hypothetical protein